MPSKSVSFSDNAYLKLVNHKPDDIGFSEWVEYLAMEGLDEENEQTIN